MCYYLGPIKFNIFMDIYNIPVDPICYTTTFIRKWHRSARYKWTKYLLIFPYILCYLIKCSQGKNCTMNLLIVIVNKVQ